GPGEPRHADTVAGREAAGARDDLGGDLVPDHEGQLRACEVAVHDVQVRATDPTRKDAEERLPGGGGRIRHLRLHERLVLPFEEHRAHRAEHARADRTDDADSGFRAPALRWRRCGTSWTIAPSSRSSSTPRT